MSINDITDMLINTCPRLRTQELNQLTAMIASYEESEESFDNIERYVDTCAMCGHMSYAERNALIESVWSF